MAKKLGNLLRGPKFSRSHSTVIDGAVPVLRFAKEMAEVTKIVLGPITVKVGGKFRIDWRIIPAGLKLTVQGPKSAQIFYVYTREPRVVKSRLKQGFG